MVISIKLRLVVTGLPVYDYERGFGNWKLAAFNSQSEDCDRFQWQIRDASWFSAKSSLESALM